MQAIRLKSDEIIQTYTLNAPVYDLWAALTERRARQHAIHFAAIQNGEQILEVAVGTGLTLDEIARRNPDGQTAGIDLTPSMLKRAQARMERNQRQNVSLQVGNAEHLNFPDHHFDLVVNNYLFDLLPEDRFVPVLREFKRVLKPRGRLVLTNMALGQKRSHRFYEWVYRLNPRFMGGCRGITLTAALGQAGFQIDRQHYLTQMGFPSELFLATPIHEK
ncbi:MAG: methyltransferase domain-containing protein [Hahellaceae bacterium]|nr:methyltransferase domain-containing protein [Hahellaceae bacterium]